MSAARILDGRQIARQLEEGLRRELAGMVQHPLLAILAFDSAASRIYKAAQTTLAASLGIDTRELVCPMDVRDRTVEETVQRWNEDPTVHGIFVHQPLPPQIDAGWLSTLIDPRKDIEGIHPQHSARRFFARARIGSCTALAVMALIDATQQPLEGKEAVVIGHSEIVGRPVSMLLLDKLATTTVCHVGTDWAGRLQEHVQRAEVLVVAIGRPGYVKGAWIRSGAIVIDVGINVVGTQVVGDVEFEDAKQRAGYLSPVPGGVGPVTVMMVMKNTLEAFKLQHGAA
jgi:methylenetetrahydrofolate dehydrogenase (NADP+)/methenyltetrahydrofolate cyclohydrolase